MHNFSKTAAIGFAAIALSITGAAAVEAQATGSVNVRSGPGTSYGVLDQLQRGDAVNVARQSPNGWCFVQKSGPDGWVSCRYLNADDAGYGDDDNDGPNVSIRFGNASRYGWNDRHDGRYHGRNWQRGSGFSFSFGN